jgi:hypothetical protein
MTRKTSACHRGPRGARPAGERAQPGLPTLACHASSRSRPQRRPGAPGLAHDEAFAGFHTGGRAAAPKFRPPRPGGRSSRCNRPAAREDCSTPRGHGESDRADGSGVYRPCGTPMALCHRSRAIRDAPLASAFCENQAYVSSPASRHRTRPGTGRQARLHRRRAQCAGWRHEASPAWQRFRLAKVLEEFGARWDVPEKVYCFASWPMLEAALQHVAEIREKSRHR